MLLELSKLFLIFKKSADALVFIVLIVFLLRCFIV